MSKFCSLSVGFGALICFGSYNPVKNNVTADALLIGFINCGTSVFSAIVVYSVLGFREVREYGIIILLSWLHVDIFRFSMLLIGVLAGGAGTFLMEHMTKIPKEWVCVLCYFRKVPLVQTDHWEDSFFLTSTSSCLWACFQEFKWGIYHYPTLWQPGEMATYYVRACVWAHNYDSNIAFVEFAFFDIAQNSYFWNYAELWSF